MNNRFARWTLLIPLAAAVACSSASQSGIGAGMAPAKDEAVSHTYTVPSGEFIRVSLENGATYRFELDGTGFRLGITPMEPGTQPPLVEQLVPGVGASGTVIYTVKPRADGVYQIRSLAGDPTQPMTLHITREVGPAKD
jgi:hypothetical protein